MVQNQTYASMRDNSNAKVFTFASRLTAPTFTSLRFHRVIILRFPPIATRLARACGRGRRPRRPVFPRAFPCARRAEDGAGTSRAEDGAGTSRAEDGAGTSRAEDGAGTSRAEDGAGTSRAEDGAGTSRAGPSMGAREGHNSLRSGRGRTRQARPSHRDTATHRGYCGNFIGQWRT